MKSLRRMAAVWFLLLGLIVPAQAAMLSNHLEYPVNAVSLWCKDKDSWKELPLTGPLEPEQQTAVTLPATPCAFIEAGTETFILSFALPQPLEAEDTLDLGYTPRYGDTYLEVVRNGKPLFSSTGSEKDRNLARDPDRNPPAPIAIGGLLDTFKIGMTEAECLKLGMPLRKVDDEDFTLKTALLSEGVTWHGTLSLWEGKLSVVGLVAPLSASTLEQLFSEMSGKRYRHVEETENGLSILEDTLLSPQPETRREAVQALLGQLAAADAEPYEASFQPLYDFECRGANATKCKEMMVQMRIAPGNNRIELVLQEYDVTEK